MYILETLSNLQKTHGVSILYITHDLTTAYHIAKSIVVLYRGSVMEAGDVDAVIKNPQHPYTQLLIDSIPWPDIKRRWGETAIQAGSGQSGIGRSWPIFSTIISSAPGINSAVRRPADGGISGSASP